MQALSTLPESSSNRSIFSRAQLEFLVRSEEEARGSEVVIRAYELAELYRLLEVELVDHHGIIPLHERRIHSWMEVTSALQLALVRRALIAWPALQAWPDAPADGSMRNFDASPAALLVDAFPAATALAVLGWTPPATPAAVAAALPRRALQRALWELRTIGGGSFPELSLLLRSHRHNRVRRGSLRAGDAAIDAPLHALPDGRRCSLLELVGAATPRPLVVLSGSYS